MDIDTAIKVFKELGVPAGFAFMLLVVWWFNRKDSRQRDENNNNLHKGHIEVQRIQTTILDHFRMGIEDNQHSIALQSTEIKNKLDLLPHQITQATDNATTTITQRMDTQHEAVLKVIGGIKDPITAINSMFQELKKTQEQAHAISLRIESALPTVTADISRIIREETKANDLQKIPIVNVNHNGADG